MIKRMLAVGMTAAAALGALGAVCAPAIALADTYPSRPITLVVPFPPGGPTDALSRRLAGGVGQAIGQTVVVENRPGAGGNIGAEYVAHAKADGYTLLFGTSGPLAINGSLYKDQRYDPQKSFAPVIRVGHLPNILVVNPKVPATNVQELIALAKSRPDSMTYASSGNGASSHLAGVMFNQMAGTKLLHVPYKGTGPALNDLLGGQVDMSFTDIMTALPHIKAGKLRAIGLASADRSAALPDLPTIAEQGLKDYDVSVFFGITAPAGTPPDVVARLNEAFAKALDDPAVKETLTNQGIVAATDRTPAGLQAFIDEQVPKWRDVVRAGNVSIN